MRATSFAENFMSRPILDESRIHSAIREHISGLHAEVVAEVRAALEAHPVVVVGMAQNPFVGRARRSLDAAGVPHHYLGYGSYFSQWRRRGALKMWSGWPTFPMVFVDGMLIGGAEDLKRLIESGELAQRLSKD
jgi:monothiol glutaredoxin